MINYKKKYIKYKNKYITLKQNRGKKQNREKFSIPKKNYIDVKEDFRTKIKEIKLSDVGKEKFTTNVDDTNKDKILLVDNIETFDKFSEKYANIYEDNDLYIDWEKVADDFKGFYLDQNLFQDRFEKAPFKGKEYYSWWDFEYYYDDVILFE